jgi:hypothetical protein
LKEKIENKCNKFDTDKVPRGKYKKDKEKVVIKLEVKIKSKMKSPETVVLKITTLDGHQLTLALNCFASVRKAMIQYQSVVEPVHLFTGILINALVRSLKNNSRSEMQF